MSDSFGTPSEGIGDVRVSQSLDVTDAGLGVQAGRDAIVNVTMVELKARFSEDLTPVRRLEPAAHDRLIGRDAELAALDAAFGPPQLARHSRCNSPGGRCTRAAIPAPGGPRSCGRSCAWPRSRTRGSPRSPSTATLRPGVRFYERLGGRVVAVPYFQPRLAADSHRVRHLMLISLLPQPGGADRVPTAPLVLFLDRYFSSCEGPQVLNEPEYRALREAVLREPAAELLTGAELDRLPVFEGCAQPVDLTASRRLHLVNRRHPGLPGSVVRPSLPWPPPGVRVHQANARIRHFVPLARLPAKVH